MNAIRRAFSALFACVLAGTGLFMAFGWPIYLDRKGTAASAVIKEKRENIRVWYAEWYRRFQIQAAYSYPGRSWGHETICDVDEKTFDSLRVGDSVPVHYIAPLFAQPFVAADHLAPCSPLASISFSSSIGHRLVVAGIPLLVILFLWQVLRIRRAVWLLFVWILIAALYVGLPRVEPEPSRPVAATAQVDGVDEISVLQLGHKRQDDLALLHPYQIVRLRFLPPGKNAAVTAVDQVDKGSVPDLRIGQNVAIVYDSQNPRIARLQQGTRQYARQAGTEVLVVFGILALLALIPLGFGRFFRSLGKRALARP